MKRQVTIGEIFASLISDRGFISRIYKGLLKHDVKKCEQSVRTWTKDIKTCCWKEYTSDKHMERCSTLLVIRKM